MGRAFSGRNEARMLINGKTNCDWGSSLAVFQISTNDSALRGSPTSVHSPDAACITQACADLWLRTMQGAGEVTAPRRAID